MVSLCFKGRPQLPGGPLGGSPWIQTKTPILATDLQKSFCKIAVKVFFKTCKRNRVSPSVVSINSTNDPYLNISITRGPSPYVHNLIYIQSVRRLSLSFGERPLTSGPKEVSTPLTRLDIALFSHRIGYLQLSPTIQNCYLNSNFHQISRI